MVFKKDDIQTKEAARKAALIREQNHNNILDKMWQIPEWKAKFAQTGREHLIKRRASMTDEEWKKHCSKAGKNSRKYEKAVADRLQKKFDYIFEPSHIFDRIAIKDNQLSFVEIKKDKDEKLKPKQKEFKEICIKLGYNYLTEFYK